jgi:hypothetical protein
MRLAKAAILLLVLVVGCRRPTNLDGIYVRQEGQGTFFPCDSVNVAFRVGDSALAAKYDLITAAPSQPIYARITAVKRRAGSPKGGWRYLEVREILEVRPRASNDCPNVAHSAATVLP